YSPAWGYDPYGFAWSPRGAVRYTYVYGRHPRPSVINPYWIGWDFRRPEWRRGHWSWRDGRGDRDSWCDWRHDWHPDGSPDDDDRGGHGGRIGRPGNGDGRGADGPDGDGPGPGRGSSGGVMTPIPTDPRTGSDGEGWGWRPDDRRGGGEDRRGTGRVGSADVITSVPGDLLPRREGRPADLGSDGVRPGRSLTGPVTPPAPEEPRIGREGRAGRSGDGASVTTPRTDIGRSWGAAGNADGLAGGPSTDGWRGRGRGGDDAGGRGRYAGDDGDTPDPGRGRGAGPRDGGD
ncbi:MAG: hypothetical protein ACO33A_07265, partial [Hyphomonas sp.]